VHAARHLLYPAGGLGVGDVLALAGVAMAAIIAAATAPSLAASFMRVFAFGPILTAAAWALGGAGRWPDALGGMVPQPRRLAPLMTWLPSPGTLCGLAYGGLTLAMFLGILVVE